MERSKGARNASLDLPRPRPAASKLKVPMHPMPRVAVIRGPSLNTWEMQNYEHLRDAFDITLFTTRKHIFDLQPLGLQVQKLTSPYEAFGSAIPILGRFTLLYLSLTKGHYDIMLGLEEQLDTFDIIHSADTCNYFTYQCAVHKKRHPHKKLVLTIWENIPFLQPLRAFFEQVRMLTRTRMLEDRNRNLTARNKKLIMQQTDHFIAVTERAKSTLILEGVEEDRISVLYMGIDTHRSFTPGTENRSLLRRRLQLPLESTILLSVGRCVREKGLMEILYALSLLRRRGFVGVHWVHVNTIGPLFRELQEKIVMLGLEHHVSFIPHTSYANLIDYYRSSDIFLLPSIPAQDWQEQFGMVLTEAMSCGLPVISAASGSIPEVVGNAGILTYPADSYDLALKIQELLGNPSLRADLSARARLRAESLFDSRRVSEEIAKIYNSLLRQHP